MLLIHPAIQATAILLVIYAFLTGLQRFRALHLKQKAVFPWKRHVLIGRVALTLLLTGLVVGFAMVRFHWGQNLMTMGHGKMALIILPFILFGLFSGQMLNRKGPKPPALRIFHGLNNTLVLILLLNQARLGIEVYRLFVAEL
jgi:hypothetical protein